MKFRALDLFCGAGGATKGLQMAGFRVTGVDINPQPRYCGDEFHQADALTFPLDGYDFIWASPPCQAWTIAGASQRRDGKIYPQLIAPVRERLMASGIPWVIENVPGAPINAHIVLCGSMFGLPIARHRGFELSSGEFRLANSCAHSRDLVSVVGHGTPSWSRRARMRRGLHPNVTVDEKRIATGIPWMNREELAQSVPPAYSEFIGKEISERLTDSMRSELVPHTRDIEKQWAVEDNPCPTCEANAAMGWILADQPFDSGDDAPPNHPNCRCSVDYRSSEPEVAE